MPSTSMDEFDCPRCQAVVGALYVRNGPHVEAICEECYGYLRFVSQSPEVLGRIVPRPGSPRSAQLDLL